MIFIVLLKGGNIMRGYPKYLSTKADYEYVREHFSKEQWQADFQVYDLVSPCGTHPRKGSEGSPKGGGYLGG